MHTGIKITAPIVIEDLNCGHGIFAASMNTPAISVIIDTHNSTDEFSFIGINDEFLRSKCEQIAYAVTRKILDESNKNKVYLSFKFKSNITPFSGLGFFEAISVSTAWAINQKQKLGLQKEELLPIIWEALNAISDEFSFSMVSACLLGGIRMSYLYADKYISKRLSLPDGLFFNILVFDPDKKEQTPKTKPVISDVISSVNLVHGLERMDFELLKIALSNWSDFGSIGIKKNLTSVGVLSMGRIGKGPSRFVLAQNDLALKEGKDAIIKYIGIEPSIISTVVDQRGVYKE
jgi:homoserine kinase